MLIWPETLDIRFEGFQQEAFFILDRLKLHPHIEQYRADREGIRTYLTEPFKRYRDDLVVNWVLPNQLSFETERNVFSRLLKNDFGAGGAHHHLWMSFHRPGRKRLSDVQLSHSLSPRGLSVGLYVGAYAGEPLRDAKAAIVDGPRAFLALVNPLLKENYRFAFYTGTGHQREVLLFEEPMPEVDERLKKASGMWLRRQISRADVLDSGGTVVERALRVVHAVWPLYELWTGRERPGMR